MSFVNNVLSELNYQGKSQSDLANSIGLKKSTISMWITRDSVPAADVAQRVADFLGVPLRYLLTGEREDAPAPKVKDVFPWLDAEGAEEISEIADGWNSLDARGRRNVMDTFRREKTETEVEESRA